MVHRIKSKRWKEAWAVWNEAGYDTSAKVFRQVFGYDYGDASIKEQLDLMDADVKKAPLWQLKELARLIKG